MHVAVPTLAPPPVPVHVPLPVLLPVLLSVSIPVGTHALALAAAPVLARVYVQCLSLLLYQSLYLHTPYLCFE